MNNLSSDNIQTETPYTHTHPHTATESTTKA